MTAVLMRAINRYVGVSSDTKPVAPPAGSIFIETDTRVRYVFDGGAWRMMP